jgi:hypothetical protein
MYDTEEIAAVIEQYGLPGLPEPDDTAEQTARLVLFRHKQGKITLADDIPLADAQEYCDREDTHGPEWFVGLYMN